jgi:hypothetical protein
MPHEVAGTIPLLLFRKRTRVERRVKGVDVGTREVDCRRQTRSPCVATRLALLRLVGVERP